MSELEPGVCAIKPEFIITDHVREVTLDSVSEKDKQLLGQNGNNTSKAKEENDDQPAEKKPRLSKKEKKKLKGQNKKRPPTFQRNPEEQLCHRLFNVAENEEPETCNNERCQNLHDIKKYLEIKPKDIGEECVNFNLIGRCPQGVACRFGSKHITPDGKIIINKELYENYKSQPSSTCNQLTKELQFTLRKRTYDFSLSEATVKAVDEQMKLLKQNKDDKNVGCVTDEDQIKLRDCEKKKIDWKGKLFLSPLTTVGNLPFRRICKEYGADITCGEMALATNIVQGTSPEWALVKRHSSEDIFGVQLCGNNPHMLAKAAQLLKEKANVDFVDLNLGCPIDLVYRQGAGCGLLRRQRVLESIVRSVSTTLGDIPMTCKTRIGVYTDELIAHKLVPKLAEWGASLITVHGRTREQRYTRLADWSYIDQCAATTQTPVFGNGDLLCYEDYDRVIKTYQHVSGVMIGRGALIKPWIFTEIKEKRLWDISASERLDVIKKYVNYGLEHWGSDSRGVETTRRFLLEWLSFLYRYIPVGVLENPPQHINERPPSYRGRDDLETLLSSPACQDWVKISEMMLGPVPDGFSFLPKHKMIFRLADWSYIDQCAATTQTPVFGNGDLLCYEDYDRVIKTYQHVSGVMIKPWIFTEIKEKRLWDISASERLDVIKKYVNYGLEHWGSDSRGVETTRRFLLEWLSFLYRYIPVGVLENPLKHINERPPSYRGRDSGEL